MGMYTTSNKINTTTVNGSSYTGIYASDGGINVILDNVTNTGIFHPCGALRVNTTGGTSYYDGSGAANTNHLFGPGR